VAISGKSGVSTGVDIKASEIGEALITVTTTASAQNLMGGSAVGRALFESATTAAALDSLGGGTVGKQIFAAATTAAVTNITGGGSSNSLIRAPGITVDGGGSVLTVGSKGFLTVPYTGTIAKWYMAADVSGSTVIDVVRSGTSIVGAGNKPTLAGDKAISASAAEWTSNAITADVFSSRRQPKSVLRGCRG